MLYIIQGKITKVLGPTTVEAILFHNPLYVSKEVMRICDIRPVLSTSKRAMRIIEEYIDMVQKFEIYRDHDGIGYCFHATDTRLAEKLIQNDVVDEYPEELREAHLNGRIQ